MSGYLGSKANPATWKRIAFECPPHEVLVSPFAGHCGLTRLMQAAPTRIVVDQDPEVIDWWRTNEPGVIPLRADSLLWLEEVALNVIDAVATRLLAEAPNYCTSEEVVQYLKMDPRGLRSDGRCVIDFHGQPLQCVPATELTLDELLALLTPASSSEVTPSAGGVKVGRTSSPSNLGATGSASATDWKSVLPTRWDWLHWCRRLVIYLDPPYVLSTRTDPGSRYRFDFTDAHHVRLLRAIRWLPCVVILSGYDSQLYRTLLRQWRVETFKATTRGAQKVRTEFLFCNHEHPEIAHDPRLTAGNKRDRLTTKRRRERQANRVARMSLGDLVHLAQVVAAQLDRQQPFLTTLERTDLVATGAACRTDNPVRHLGATGSASADGQDCPSYEPRVGAADNDDQVLGTVNLRSQNGPSRDPAAGSDADDVGAAPRVIAAEADAEDLATVSHRWESATSDDGTSSSVSVPGVNRPAEFDVTPLRPTVWGPLANIGETVGFITQRGDSPAVKRPSECERPDGAETGQVLSLFPGIGLLDKAFEALGFSVVRGPDLIWGGDIRQFDATALRGKVWGVIGGPPCQDFSKARMIAPTGNGEEMIDEYKRVIAECEPAWWMAENVPCVPDIQIDGFSWQRVPIDLEWFAPVRRRRHIQFGSRVETYLDLRPPTPLPTWRKVHDCVVASRRGGLGWKKKRELMGLPKTWDVPALLRDELSRALGNGVPIPMGKFLAAAVAAAFGVHGRTVSELTVKRCQCPCRRPVSGKAHYFETNCRKIAETRRKLRACDE